MNIEQFKTNEANKHSYIRKKALENSDPRTSDDIRMAESFNGYIVGFEAVLSLNLPIKFLKWVIDDNRMEQIHYDVVLREGQIKDLYDFWLNNVYTQED